jgi:hypothetical protein
VIPWTPFQALTSKSAWNNSYCHDSNVDPLSKKQTNVNKDYNVCNKDMAPFPATGFYQRVLVTDHMCQIKRPEDCIGQMDVIILVFSKIVYFIAS